MLSSSVARLPRYDEGGGSQGFRATTAPSYWHWPLGLQASGLITAPLCNGMPDSQPARALGSLNPGRDFWNFDWTVGGGRYMARAHAFTWRAGWLSPLRSLLCRLPSGCLFVWELYPSWKARVRSPTHLLLLPLRSFINYSPTYRRGREEYS